MAEMDEPVKATATASLTPKPVAAVNVRPHSAINNEKKKKLQPKFDKIKEKVEVAKEKA